MFTPLSLRKRAVGAFSRISMGASGSKSAKAETLAAAAEIAQQSQPPSPARPGAPEGNSRVVPVSPGTRAANSQPAPAVEPGGGGGAAVRRERPIVQQHIIAGSPASLCGGLPVEKLESPNSHELDDEALASEYMANQATVSSTPRSGGIEHAAMGGSSIPSIMVGGGGGGSGGDGGGGGGGCCRRRYGPLRHNGGSSFSCFTFLHRSRGSPLSKSLSAQNHWPSLKSHHLHFSTALLHVCGSAAAQPKKVELWLSRSGSSPPTGRRSLRAC